MKLQGIQNIRVIGGFIAKFQWFRGPIEKDYNSTIHCLTKNLKIIKLSLELKTQ